MEVPLGTFFEDADRRPAASARGAGRTMNNSIVKHTEESLIRLSNAVIKYTFLSNEFPGRQFEIVIGEIQPGTTYPLAPHEGEEFGYVLEGRLKFMIEDQTYSLGPGDSYHFDATRPHTYEAEGQSLVRVLWVGTLKYFQDRANSSPLRGKSAAL
jgi:quercetin dioxygenase-like cupin family protein